MSDKILIRDLLIRGIIGIHDWEREKKQDILINIEMEADCRPAGLSDDFQDAVDYRAVTKSVIALVENSAFFLVEKMAEEIASDLPGKPQGDSGEGPGGKTRGGSVLAEASGSRWSDSRG